MIKTLFLVPIRDNDGRRFRERAWDDLEGQLVGVFGGFSRRAGVVGGWEADGRVYRDRSREYTIGLASWRQLPAFLEIIDQACLHFHQEAMYVEIAGVPEVLHRPM